MKVNVLGYELLNYERDYFDVLEIKNSHCVFKKITTNEILETNMRKCFSFIKDGIYKIEDILEQAEIVSFLET